MAKFNLDKRKIIPVVIVVLLFFVWKYQQNSRLSNYAELRGTTMGPIVYNIKYLDGQKRDFQVTIDSLLRDFNQSLSTYISDSEISRFNTNGNQDYKSPYFYPILKLSEEVHSSTLGAFDPTIAPLVNAWGFGPDGRRDIDSLNIDSLRNLIGFEKISFNQNTVSGESNVQLDFSAVAKGYAVDVVSEFLEDRGIEDYMVEIGGEVKCLGRNPEGKAWRIGIEDPTVSFEDRELFATAVIPHGSLATSGNYRNYYEKDGKRYAHTISPFTGYPVEHSLLSVSVFTKNCMRADALATGFMVLGYEKSLEIVNEMDSVDAFFIYASDDGQLHGLATEGVKNRIGGDFLEK